MSNIHYNDIKVFGNYINDDSLLTKNNLLKKYHDISLFSEDYYYNEQIQNNKVFTKSLPNVDCVSVTKEEAIFLLRFWDPWGTDGTRPSYSTNNVHGYIWETWPIDLWSAEIILADLMMLRIKLFKLDNKNTNNVFCGVYLSTYFNRPRIIEPLNIYCKGEVRYNNILNQIGESNVSGMQYSENGYPPNIHTATPINSIRLDNGHCVGGFRSSTKHIISISTGINKNNLHVYESEIIPLDDPVEGLVLDGNTQKCLLKIRRNIDATVL